MRKQNIRWKNSLPDIYIPTQKVLKFTTWKQIKKKQKLVAKRKRVNYSNLRRMLNGLARKMECPGCSCCRETHRFQLFKQFFVNLWHNHLYQEKKINMIMHIHVHIYYTKEQTKQLFCRVNLDEFEKVKPPKGNMKTSRTTTYSRS